MLLSYHKSLQLTSNKNAHKTAPTTPKPPPQSQSYYAQIMQPVLTDDEIIATFTPIEHEFRLWFEGGGYVAMIRGVQDGRSETISSGFQTAWPDVEHVREKWNEFIDKWILRRSSGEPMSGEDFISLVRSTQCNDANELARYPLTFEAHTLEFVSLGISYFGGTFAEYMVWVDDCDLRPDSASSKLDDEPQLHNRVLSIDFNNDFSASLPNVQDSSELLPEEKTSSAQELSITTQSAITNDSLDNEPFCFFQIGGLKYYAGWPGPLYTSLSLGATFNQSTYERSYDGEHTDYEVVVQVGPGGCPTGAVYVIHNPKSLSPLPYETSNTLPGPLARGSSPPFFLAKIADSVQDLNRLRVFDFETVLKERHNIVRTKVDEASGKIIPDV
ncbi:hypothetical protein EDB80DRAFT_827579 [Ilyonectria destructans]|nr:hypothetical protein EDB80DRAFT_827579 [Ilyonectria destructans]